MHIDIKPRVIISKCLEFDNCRYNGQIISSIQVKELKPFIEFIPICPEVEIGLGIPRDPIRIIYENNKQKLIQSKSGKDLTNKMNSFTKSFLEKQKNIDGFILKTRSPSCGLKEVKIYPGDKKVAPIGKKAGFFGKAVLKKFPLLAIEDEGRLRNPTIREHFLRRIYTYARFRSIKKEKNISSLINFQTENKFLIMSYSQSKLKDLGRIVATAKKEQINTIYLNYEKLLHKTFSYSPKCTSITNVLLHSFGYMSDNLSSDEKSYFLNELKKYRESKVPLVSILAILNSWIVRFNETYLKKQTFFSPYPEQLIHPENIDSCASRDYWK